MNSQDEYSVIISSFTFQYKPNYIISSFFKFSFCCIRKSSWLQTAVNLIMMCRTGIRGPESVGLRTNTSDKWPVRTGQHFWTIISTYGSHWQYWMYIWGRRVTNVFILQRTKAIDTIGKFQNLFHKIFGALEPKNSGPKKWDQ